MKLIKLLFSKQFRPYIVTGFILSTIVILGATLYPSDFSMPTTIWDYDKIGHAMMFLVWTLIFGLFLFVLKNNKPSLVLIFVVSASFGLLIEVLQFILPAGRSAELWDFIADIIGSGIAITLLYQIFRFSNREERSTPVN